MNINNTDGQFYAFLVFCAIGIVLSAIFYATRLLVNSKSKHYSTLKILADIIFIVVMYIVVLLSLYYFNNAHLEFYVGIAIIVGFCVGHFMFVSPLDKLIKARYNIADKNN